MGNLATFTEGANTGFPNPARRQVHHGPHCTEEVTGTEVKLPVQGHTTVSSQAPRPVLLTIIPRQGKSCLLRNESHNLRKMASWLRPQDLASTG